MMCPQNPGKIKLLILDPPFSTITILSYNLSCVTLTGIDSPYERPDDAELIIDGAKETAEEAALVIVRELERKGLLAVG